MARLDLVVEAIVKGQNNIKGLSNDLDAIDGSAKRLDTSFKGLVKAGAAIGGGLLGVQAAAQAVEFLSDAVNKAAEFEDVVSASAVTMGTEAVPALEEWADNAASAFGASKQLALESAVQMSVFGKSAGLAGDELTDFATEMTALGGDLASFFGGSTEEAITAIGAALRGESEPIRRYGVLLDDATLRQRAFEMGLVSTTKNALSPQVRVLAAQAEILAQTSDAQGDFGRTSEGMANTQREIAAEMENLQIEIGQKLMPVVLEVAHFIRDTVIPVFGHFGEAIDFVGELINNAVNPFGPLLDDQKKAAKETDKLIEHQADAWADYSNVLSSAFKPVQEAAQKIARIPIEEIEAHWDEVRRAAFETTVQQKLGLLDGQNQIKVGMEALTRLQAEEQTKQQRIAYLTGLLNSQQLAAGLRDGRPGVRGAANALRAQIVAELAGLGVNAYNSGYSVGSNVAAGIYASSHLADGASSYLAAKISGYLPRSNALVGPLSDIMDVGGAIVTSITGEMIDHIGQAERASALVASALAVSPLTASALGSDVSAASVASGGFTGPSGGVTIILNVEGDLTTDREAGVIDLIRRSGTVAGFGDLDSVIS